jgi:truncated hemoglobin YjbI
MASTDAPDDNPAPARWRPCDRACNACHATLRWPVRAATESSISLHDLRPAAAALPSVPQPAHSLLALCGEAGLRRLVHRHMTRLRLTPLLADMHDCFDCIAERVADFVIESCGGPLYWSERHSPHQGLTAGAGWPVLLDEVGREIWLVQLWHSLDDVGLSERLRADFWHWAEPLSLHLLAPRARQGEIRRYPFELVSGWFRSAPELPESQVARVGLPH